MESIFKRLDLVIEFTEKTTKYFDGRERNEIMLFGMCMLERLNFACEGLKVLLNQFTINTKLEYSAGIIIRSLLLDHLIVMNAMEVYGIYKDGNDRFAAEMKAFCLMMLSDGVKNTLEYFENYKTKVSPEIMKKMYVNLVASNPECFEEYANDGSVPVLKTKEFISPKKLYHKLKNSRDLNKYASAYEAYLYYSKYDHFGSMFNFLLRVSILDKLNHIDKVSTIFPKSLIFTLTILVAFYPCDQTLQTYLLDAVAQFETMGGSNATGT